MQVVAAGTTNADKETVQAKNQLTRDSELLPDGRRRLDPQMQGRHMATAMLDVGFKFRADPEIIGRGSESVVFGLKGQPELAVLYPVDYTRVFWVAQNYPKAKALSDQIAELPDAKYVMRIIDVNGSYPKRVPFMVVERAENGSVADMIAAKSGLQTLGPSHPKMIVNALGDMARGIRALHTLGKVHGDLKPENMLVDADLTFKVGDLTHVTDVNGMPLSGFAGTPEYCDKARQLNHGRPSQQSDVYALGVIATEMALGRRLQELKKLGAVSERQLANGSTWYEINKSAAEIDSSVSPVLSQLSEALRGAKDIHEAIRLIETAHATLNTSPNAAPLRR